MANWEDQDDTFDVEVQLAALWLALANVSDMLGDPGKANVLGAKHNEAMRIVRKKYNPFKANRAVKQVSF